MEIQQKIAVIGGGAAGVMAALRCVLNNDQCLFFPGTGKDKKRSRAMWVKKVENMPGFHDFKRGIEDPNMSTIKWIQQSEFKDNLAMFKSTGVEQVKKEGDIFHITDSKGKTHQADYVILCTGIMDVQPHILGSIEPILPFANKQTVDYCIRCDGHHVKDKETVVIGHRDVAAWVSIILYERYHPPKMTILTNGKDAEIDDSTQRILDAYGIEKKTSEISEVLGDAKAGELEGFLLADGKNIQAQMAFVSLGMIAYNELAKQVDVKMDQRGRIITDEKGETSVANFFVAGDLRANAKMQIYTAWDQAVDSADVCNSRIRRIKREKFLSAALI